MCKWRTDLENAPDKGFDVVVMTAVGEKYRETNCFRLEDREIYVFDERVSDRMRLPYFDGETITHWALVVLPE